MDQQVSATAIALVVSLSLHSVLEGAGIGAQSSVASMGLVVAAVLMVFVRYLGEAQLMHAALAFLIGLAFWLYILGELFFGRMDTAVRESDHDAIRRGYFWLRLIVTVGWAIYPLGNFIMSFGSFIDGGAISVTYNVADFLNRMTFGVAVLATAIMATRHPEAHAAGDNEEHRP